MDFLLPVAPGGVDGRFYTEVKHWRDIARSGAVEIELVDVDEPISLDMVKRHLNIDVNLSDDDTWIIETIPAARRQVEMDSNRTLPPTVLEMTFDQFPLESVFPLPKPPLISIDSIKSYDLLTGAETVFAASNYLVDAYSQPGRVALVTGAIWPTGVRWYQGAKVRWTAGYQGAARSIASITRAGTTATVTMVDAHKAKTGQRWRIAGADQADYNVAAFITVTGPKTFTYDVANAPASPATGTLTAASLVFPERYLHAMKLLLGHWYMNREAVTSGSSRYTPDLYPLGYDALIGDRVVSVG